VTITNKVVGESKGLYKLAENLVATQLEKGITEDGQRLKALLEKS
jgi:hypothetical protein